MRLMYVTCSDCVLSKYHSPLRLLKNPLKTGIFYLLLLLLGVDSFIVLEPFHCHQLVINCV